MLECAAWFAAVAMFAADVVDIVAEVATVGEPLGAGFLLSCPGACMLVLVIGPITGDVLS